MVKKWPFIEHLYTMLIGIALSFSLSLSSIASTTITYVPLELLAFCLGFVVFFYLITIPKRGALIFFITLLVAFLGFFVVFLINNGLEQSYKIIASKVYYLINLLVYPHMLSPNMQLIIILLVVCMFSLFAVMCVGKSAGSVIIMLFGIFFFSVQIISNNFYLPEHTTAFYIFIILIPIIILKQVNASFFKNNVLNKIRPTVSLAWISVPLSLAIVFMLSSFINIEATINDFDLSRLFPDIYFNDGFGEFELFQTGFGDFDGKLGGRTRLDDTRVLSVDTNNPIYLSGHVKEIYDGTKWTSNRWEKQKDEEIEFTETQRTMDYINGLGSKTIVPTDRFADIEYLSFNLRTIFRPSKTYDVSVPDGYILWKNKNDELYVQKNVGRGFEYSLDYYNYKTETYASSLKKINSANANDSSLQQYLELPGSTTQRVRDLTESIVGGIGNDYDKVLALQEYLKKFPYTLETASVPDGKDFVDYFLFEEQKGYCTYYASALAIMSRIAGIPSRYIEGYGPTYREKFNGDFILTNEQAHAWTEVYFDGAGWLQFEPTPPYNMIISGNKPPESVFSPEMQKPEYEKYLESFRPITGTVSSKPKVVEITPVKPNVTPELPDGGGLEDEINPDIIEKSILDMILNMLPYIFLFVITPILIIAAILFFFELGGNAKRMREVEGLSPRVKIIFYSEKILKLTKFDRKPRELSESMLAYALRINKSYPLQKITLMDAAQIFETISYSKETATNDQSEKVADAYNALNDYIKSSFTIKDKIRYFIHQRILRRL